VALIKDDDCVKALKVLHDNPEVLVKFGVDRETAIGMRELFGVSGICNILGAIKTAKYLKLGPGDNVVTVATDGFDRYQSVLEDLDRRYLETTDHVLERWFQDIFHGMDESNVVDFRRADKKEQLFEQKEKDWLPFGYSKAYLDDMRSPEFWEIAYNKIQEYDEKIMTMRG